MCVSSRLKPRDFNAAINDREHQDVEVNGADFPVRPIQRQGVRPGNAEQLHDEQREFGMRHLEFAPQSVGAVCSLNY